MLFASENPKTDHTPSETIILLNSSRWEL